MGRESDLLLRFEIILCFFFVFLKTGRRASTHGASGKRSKVRVIIHSKTNVCYIAGHHKLCLSVCIWLVCPLYY